MRRSTDERISCRAGNLAKQFLPTRNRALHLYVRLSRVYSGMVGSAGEDKQASVHFISFQQLWATTVASPEVTEKLGRVAYSAAAFQARATQWSGQRGVEVVARGPVRLETEA